MRTLKTQEFQPLELSTERFLIGVSRWQACSRPKIPEVLLWINSPAIAPNQPGRVKYKASYWSAKLYPSDRETSPLTPGQLVGVVGREGITLLVQSFQDRSE